MESIRTAAEGRETVIMSQTVEECGQLTVEGEGDPGPGPDPDPGAGQGIVTRLIRALRNNSVLAFVVALFGGVAAFALFM